MAAAVLACIAGASLALRPAPAYASPTVILMYHHVSPQVLPGPYARALTVTPQEFETQLAWLQAHHCALLTVTGLVSAAQGSGGCAVALTFDDGYDDAVLYALPLLQRYHALGTFYIASGLVGNSGHVSVRNIRQLVAAGMEIGAHTVHHADLTALTSSQAANEIRDSRTALQRWSGEPVTSFAYPAGQTDAAVAAQVRAAGYATAVTTQPGMLEAASDRYSLPRYRIERAAGAQLIADVLGHNAGAIATRSPSIALVNIARARIEGNAPDVAESIAVALLARHFAEPISKVHVLAIPAATIAGITLSGTKFHARRDRAHFVTDVSAMAALAFAAAPQVREVDIWATVPVSVPAGAAVSGDLAVPAAKTVFSAVATRRAGQPNALQWGTMYWDPAWSVESASE